MATESLLPLMTRTSHSPYGYNQHSARAYNEIPLLPKISTCHATESNFGLSAAILQLLGCHPCSKLTQGGRRYACFRHRMQAPVGWVGGGCPGPAKLQRKPAHCGTHYCRLYDTAMLRGHCLTGLLVDSADALVTVLCLPASNMVISGFPGAFDRIKDPPGFL